MRRERELQYSSMICVATKDSSRTKFETKKILELEKPRDFDPFGQAGFAHLWLQYD